MTRGPEPARACAPPRASVKRPTGRQFREQKQVLGVEYRLSYILQCLLCKFRNYPAAGRWQPRTRKITALSSFSRHGAVTTCH